MDVEFDRAKNGKTVVKVQGRLLSSSFDPEKEAVKWCDAVLKTGPSDLCCVVLGLGAGYHVVELQSRLQKPVVVIENIACLQEHFEDYFREILKQQRILNPGACRCLTFADEKSFRSSPDIDFLFTQPYRVVVHTPSFELQSEFYLQVRNLLMGRDAESLAWQIERRGLSEDFGAPQLAERTLADPSGPRLRKEVLSIRDLQDMKSPDDVIRPSSRAIMSLLGELVR